MSNLIADWNEIAKLFQSLVTTTSILIGGMWVYLKYVRQQERYPNIESSAEIKLIGVQGGYWIAEIVATVENKGKTQHRMYDFFFNMFAISADDPVNTDPRWNGQVNFPHEVVTGSFLPKQYKFFYVDPGVTAKYSYIARIPVNYSFVILHWYFMYGDNRKFKHVAECTIQLDLKKGQSQQPSATLGGFKK
ncbi:hypothetical protein [Craterilacuibacter sp. RT1T]|uniref:hypothetical protein n=1 Tax=Craterilacuibacter sp. RT1T TaxID=2942211 RepID=UPI0020BDE98A|nr:hypothetical protein [Craterilacuibacter sp. RT1T]MCL6262983.1 hypothetical protein [Craterilacuibacter sp. RT1T]